MQNRIEKSNTYQPNRDLEIFCYALVHQDVKGNKEAAERLSGVCKGKFYYHYKNDENFRRWYSELCFSILKHNEAIPPYALMGAIIDKDVQAIRTYYELIGKLKAQGVNIETKINNVSFTVKEISATDTRIMHRVAP